MNLTIPKIVAILLFLMVGIFAAWEIFETVTWGAGPPASAAAFYLARGVSTAVVMSVLSAWLMIRYRRRYEQQISRQAEEAQRTRLFFENIVQDAGEAIISLDNDGVIRSWNRAAERIYGYTAEEIVGKSFTRLVPPRLVAAGEPEKILEQVRSRGFVRNYETIRSRKDGAEITVRITRSLLRDPGGAILGWSAIVSDVTAEKQMEARLMQAEKMALIGQLAARTAHEVRNALAGIWGTVEVLQGSSAWREIPPDIAEEVRTQVGRIAHIVDDLLAYARPASPARQRIDVREVLDRAISSVSSSPEAAGKATVRDDGGTPIYADIDPLQIEQLFRNLLENAYQAMEPGGTLHLSARATMTGVEVTFADEGAGMSPEILARATEPFFTTKAKGSGLGLAIARTIVEAHGGALRLDSSPEGTTVSVILPPPAVAQEAA